MFVQAGSALARGDGDKEHFAAVLEAFKASDSGKEQNLFCKGSCHLAKASHRVTSVDIDNTGARTLLEVLATFPGIYVKKRSLRPSNGWHLWAVGT